MTDSAENRYAELQSDFDAKQRRYYHIAAALQKAERDLIRARSALESYELEIWVTESCCRGATRRAIVMAAAEVSP